MEAKTLNDTERMRQSRDFWDGEAAAFDDAPDHGLRDPVVREAWTFRLQNWLPSAPAAVLDIGCGTGSLSVVMASLGHHVTGIDASPLMIAQAEAKAHIAERPISYQVMDAAQPQFPSHSFDVIVCRHLLWALPDPAHALECWLDLLSPGGRLILIEGYWHTGAGLRAAELTAWLPSSFINIALQHLSSESELWGGEVTDERYCITAALPAAVPPLRTKAGSKESV